jgi:hypothetical protein
MPKFERSRSLTDSLPVRAITYTYASLDRAIMAAERRLETAVSDLQNCPTPQIDTANFTAFASGSKVAAGALYIVAFASSCDRL